MHFVNSRVFYLQVIPFDAQVASWNLKALMWLLTPKYTVLILIGHLVKCWKLGCSILILIQLFYKCIGAPGMPQNIQASISTPSRVDCMILLQWDLPIEVTASFISHYIVDFKSGTWTISPQSTTAALTIENCNLNATIGIHAVDICGRQGARAQVDIIKNVLQEAGNVTEPQNQITAASQLDGSTFTSRLLSLGFTVHHSIHILSSE